MSFAEVLAADTRLLILRSLCEDQGYSANESILQEMLALFGRNLSRDRLRTELRWLEEQGLVEVSEVTGVMVAKINGRGCDVAAGVARVDGVKRPRPR
ncbi:ArsR family transcriptional regulator [Geoalkalibacter halelectricus]|uniref:VpaChn25_0724 family phage protein n=1 Tax=Geoalkalibacter halelectricus TaxID=2847045 RepID=UPI003D1A9C89